jgi:hypothetical protein
VGEVLEMIGGRITTLMALAGLALMSCGTDVDETLSAQSIAAVGQSAVRGTRQVAAQPSGVTRAGIEGLGRPADMVVVERLGASAAIIQAGMNGDTETWVTFDQKTVAIRQGQIVATRGLQGDLVAAQVPPLSRIASATGAHDRTLVTIGDDDQTLRQTYACTLSGAGTQTITVLGRSHATRRVQETCTGVDAQFTNDYWFEGGILRQTRQWMGQNLGYITHSRVRA